MTACAFKQQLTDMLALFRRESLWHAITPPIKVYPIRCRLTSRYSTDFKASTMSMLRTLRVRNI